MPELPEVETEPDNQPIVLAFRADSRPRPRSDPWSIDQFELRTHPDLCQRVDQIAERLPGAHRIPLYGRLTLAHPSGRLILVAEGTGWLSLRLPGLVERESLRFERRPHPTFGPPWTVVDGWLVDVPLPDHIPLLAGLAAEALELGTAPTDRLLGKADA